MLQYRSSPHYSQCRFSFKVGTLVQFSLAKPGAGVKAQESQGRISDCPTLTTLPLELIVILILIGSITLCLPGYCRTLTTLPLELIVILILIGSITLCLPGYCRTVPRVRSSSTQGDIDPISATGPTMSAWFGRFHFQQSCFTS